MTRSSLLQAAALGCTLALGCSTNRDPGSVAAPDAVVDTIVLRKDSSTTSADGVSTIAFTATSTQVHVPGALVSFTTSVGSFLPGGASILVPLDDSGHAHAELKAPIDPALARITAVLNDAIAFDSVSFVRAMPDRLSLATDRITLFTSDTGTLAAASTKVTATILRKLGVFGSGQVIQFSAHEPGDTSHHRGVINPTFVGASPATAASFASAVATFFADTALGGRVVLRASVVGRPSVFDTVVVQVNRVPK